MEEVGIVHKINSKNGWAVVRFDRKLACENCNMCFKPKEENYVEIKVKNALNAKEGDRVKISMATRAVLTASFLVYVIPLVLVGIVLLATYSLKNEWLSLGLGLGTLVLSFVGLIFIEKIVSKKKRFFPEMLEIINEDSKGDTGNSSEAATVSCEAIDETDTESNQNNNDKT